MSGTKSVRLILITFTSVALSMVLMASRSTGLHAEGTFAMAPTHPRATTVLTTHATAVMAPSRTQPAGAAAPHPRQTFATAIMHVHQGAATLPAKSGTGSATQQPPPAQPSDQSSQVVRLAKRDLAKRLGVPPGQIDLVSVNKVDWSDNSLGEPQSGLTYSQIVTPGYQIVLQVGDQAYVYHSDTGQRVVYCTAP